MKKGTRRTLFWFAVAIFAVATYVAILYAQGYKYDFTQNVFVRTGAVAVTANTDAQMAINGRSAGAMSLLGHRAGVSSLLPGSYAITVKKEGYSAWAKTATVQEGLLTDFPSVLLVPLASESQPELMIEIARAVSHSYAAPVGGVTLTKTVLYRTIDGELTPVADKVLGFVLTENNDRILWWTRNEIWVLWLDSTDYQPYRSANEQQLVTRFSVPVIRAGWFHDRDHIVVDLGAGGYRIIETDLRGGINIVKI